MAPNRKVAASCQGLITTLALITAECHKKGVTTSSCKVILSGIAKNITVQYVLQSMRDLTQIAVSVK